MKTFRFDLSVYAEGEDEIDAYENVTQMIHEDACQLIQNAECIEVCPECRQTDCGCQEAEDYKTFKRCAD